MKIEIPKDALKKIDPKKLLKQIENWHLQYRNESTFGSRDKGELRHSIGFMYPWEKEER